MKLNGIHQLLASADVTWVDNIKRYLVEIRWGDMGWVDLAKDRDKWRALFTAVMNPRASLNTVKFLSGYTTSDLSSNAQHHVVIKHFCRPPFATIFVV
jgi:hypothetical protein